MPQHCELHSEHWTLVAAMKQIVIIAMILAFGALLDMGPIQKRPADVVRIKTITVELHKFAEPE